MGCSAPLCRSSSGTAALQANAQFKQHEETGTILHRLGGVCGRTRCGEGALVANGSFVAIASGIKVCHVLCGLVDGGRDLVQAGCRQRSVVRLGNRVM